MALSPGWAGVQDVAPGLSPAKDVLFILWPPHVRCLEPSAGMGKHERDKWELGRVGASGLPVVTGDRGNKPRDVSSALRRMEQDSHGKSLGSRSSGGEQPPRAVMVVSWLRSVLGLSLKFRAAPSFPCPSAPAAPGHSASRCAGAHVRPSLTLVVLVCSRRAGLHAQRKSFLAEVSCRSGCDHIPGASKNRGNFHFGARHWSLGSLKENHLEQR